MNKGSHVDSYGHGEKMKEEEGAFLQSFEFFQSILKMIGNQNFPPELKRESC